MMRGCRDKFSRPNTGINRSVPTVSNAPITLGSGAATGELMKMSSAAWRSATAPIDPQLEGGLPIDFAVMVSHLERATPDG